MGMSGGKKVQAPKLKKYEGSPYTDYLEKDLPGYHDWVANNWETALTAPKLEDYYAYAKQVTEPAMRNFLEDYNTQANRIASRNYNRFGGLRNTPAMYTQDMYNKQMNDQSQKLAAQALSDAYTMKNQDWANALNAFGVGYDLFNNAGQYVDQNIYKRNWEIENQNEINRVEAANRNAERSGGFLGTALGTVGGALGGFLTGGPAGAIAGGLGGLASGLSGGNIGQSTAFGTGITRAGLQSPTGGLNWLNSKLGYTIR